MKKQIDFQIIILLLVATMLQAQNSKTNWHNWSSGTAFTLPDQRLEKGIFQPLRYGLTDKLELSAHPIIFFAAPNVKIKRQHGELGVFTVASRHGITIPSPLLGQLAREGTGGIISPEFDIPFIISMQNELLMSTEFTPGHLFTGKVGINFAWHADELDTRTTIDLPVVFARTHLYYQGIGMTVAGQFQGHLYKCWNYRADANFWYYPGAAGNLNSAFEQKGTLLWSKSDSFQFSFGYLLSFAEYPFGTQWHLLPLLDLQWAWPKNGKCCQLKN